MTATFVDSNVFIYMFDETDYTKRAAAEAVVDEVLEKQTGVVSFQVVQETLNVISRNTSSERAMTFLRVFLQPLWKVMPSQELYERALELQQRYRYRFYDSLIIAAALEVGCTRLLSEDMRHSQVIQGLKIHNPFLDTED